MPKDKQPKRENKDEIRNEQERSDEVREIIKQLNTSKIISATIRFKADW